MKQEILRPEEVYFTERTLPKSVKFHFGVEDEPKQQLGVQSYKKRLKKIAKKNKSVVFHPLRFTLSVPGQEPESVKEKGKLCEFIRADNTVDRFATQLIDTRPCPKIYEQTVGYFANFCNNRLTVYDTELWDGKMRPIYSMNNYSQLAHKNDINRFSKLVDKPHVITCFDWIGNDEETQIVFAEKTGTMFRACLQQRSVVAAWKDGEEQKQIATHYKSTVFAAVDKKNTIRFYTTEDLDSKVQSVVIAELKFPGNVIEMQWFGEELFLLSEDGKIWKVLFKLSELQKIKPASNDFVFYPKRKKAEKILTLEAKEVYEFDRKYKDLVKFKKAGELVNGFTALIQCKNGTIIELDMNEIKIVNTMRCNLLNSKFGFALHRFKNIIATSNKAGKLVLLKYPRGTEAQSLVNRGHSLGNGGQCIHWCLGKYKDSIIVTSGRTMTRFLPKHSKILNTKRADSNCFTQGLPYSINAEAMDQSNVDHNHRHYQFNTIKDAISLQFNEVEEMRKRVATRTKCLHYHMKYHKCIVQPENLDQFEEAENLGKDWIKPPHEDWIIPDKVDLSEEFKQTKKRKRKEAVGNKKKQKTTISG